VYFGSVANKVLVHCFNSQTFSLLSFFLIEEGCSYDEVPFELLNGENVEYLALLEGEELIGVSNYRLLATHKDGAYSVSGDVQYVASVSGDMGLVVMWGRVSGDVG